jgi:hypothetical protein
MQQFLRVVAATMKISAEEVLLRSYRNPKIPEHAEYKIWEAARATTAAPTYFESSDTDLVPSLKQNPIMSIYAEARSLWPERNIQLVSIGAGGGVRNRFTASLGERIEGINQILLDSEDEARKFEYLHTGSSFHLTMYRFNPIEELQGVALDEYKVMSQIEARIMNYLRSMDVQDRMRRCIEELSEITYEGLKSLTLLLSYD